MGIHFVEGILLSIHVDGRIIVQVMPNSGDIFFAGRNYGVKTVAFIRHLGVLHKSLLYIVAYTFKTGKP